MRAPLIVAIEMGYGHMRPATALAQELGGGVLECDRPPLADDEEQTRWARVRSFYEGVSRLSQLPLVGTPLRALLDSITHIPSLHPRRDLSAPSLGARAMAREADRGLGAGMVARLRDSHEPLLTTFYAPALIADRRGLDDVYCVVTDSDVNRVWAPLDGQRSKIRFLAPSLRVERRLLAYGVRRWNVEVTGYPLPPALLGGEDLGAARRSLLARLHRLDPERRFVRGGTKVEIERRLGGSVPGGEPAPPLVVFAVGGAGAQAGLPEQFLPSLAPMILAGRLRVALVAGVRAEVAAGFRATVADIGLEGKVHILHEPDLPAYFRAFDALLAEADVLWSKPSEITFFAALGLPLVFSPPVGVHERYNRRWAVEAGAGLAQREPDHAGDWLDEWLADGTLAAAAWSGFTRLPNRGLYKIAARFRKPS